MPPVSLCGKHLGSDAPGEKTKPHVPTSGGHGKIVPYDLDEHSRTRSVGGGETARIMRVVFSSAFTPLLYRQHPKEISLIIFLALVVLQFALEIAH